MIVDVVTAFYGPLHARMFRETLLPSLEQASNLPALIDAGHEVRHYVYCTEDDVSTLPNVPLPHQINTSLLTPINPALRRDAIHIAYKEAIARGNLTICAQPDHVFGNGLAGAVEGLQSGEYLVCPHPRIELEDGLSLASELVKANPTNAEWVDFFMSSVPHSLTYKGKGSQNPYWRTAWVLDHWETYFQEPPPIAFIGTPDMLDVWKEAPPGANLEVLDHQLVDYCFRHGRLKSIMDSRNFVWAELTPRDVYTNGIKAHFEHLASCQHFNKTPARWYFK